MEGIHTHTKIQKSWPREAKRVKEHPIASFAPSHCQYLSLQMRDADAAVRLLITDSPFNNFLIHPIFSVHHKFTCWKVTQCNCTTDIFTSTKKASGRKGKILFSLSLTLFLVSLKVSLLSSASLLAIDNQITLASLSLSLSLSLCLVVGLSGKVKMLTTFHSSSRGKNCTLK